MRRGANGGTLIDFVCDQCGDASQKRAGDYNRSKKNGANLFCSRKCAHESRRIHKSLEQKKEEKRLYDLNRRQALGEELRKQKRAYYQRVKVEKPEMLKAARQRRMPKHIEYCRRPEYRAKKHIYDRERYAKKNFGEMWESHVAIMAITEEIESRMSKYEVRLKNKTLNKSLQRSRNGETKRRYA